MLKLNGKINNAVIYSDNVEKTAINQIVGLLNEEITKDTMVRIMPDVHAGKGTTIGTTIKLPSNRNDWKICPNVTGVDIGCSMRAVRIKDDSILDLEKLDKIVNTKIPAGRNIHSTSLVDKELINDLVNKLSFKLSDDEIDYLTRSCGTLGGGNHFIELGVSDDGQKWLVVHSGSRKLGVLVAKHHQKIAESQIYNPKLVIAEIIKVLKSQGNEKEINNEIVKFKESGVVPSYVTYTGIHVLNKDLAYLNGKLLDDYLNDVVIDQKYSILSRKLMLLEIVKAMNWTIIDEFESMHNYIDVENGILRKGATSAQLGERLIIPLNMRDGSIFATGKGNPDWNYSAPHGAGRILSRTQAKDLVSLEDFKDTMKDVYTSSISEFTLDESPFAYKDKNQIINFIGDTVNIDFIVKPIYNFKAKE